MAVMLQDDRAKAMVKLAGIYTGECYRDVSELEELSLKLENIDVTVTQFGCCQNRPRRT